MKKSVNWRQAAAEVGLILLGLLLAFSVDRLWEARQERATEQAYLARLTEEFVVVRRELQSAIDRQNALGSAQRGVLEALATDDVQEIAEELPALLPIALTGFPIRLATSMYDELESTGQLGLLSTELRSALTRFDTILEGSFARSEATQTEMWIHRTQPFLDAHLTPDVYVSPADRETWKIRDSPFSVDWGDASLRRELWSLVSHRIIFGSIRTGAVQDLLAIAEEVLEELDRGGAA